MGVNQDIGPYSVVVGGEEGVLLQIGDSFASPGVISLFLNVDTGQFFDGATINFYLDDVLDGSYSIADYYNEGTGKYQVDWLASITKATQLRIEMFNIENGSLNFREFAPATSGKVVFNETFNGAFDEFWITNDFGNDLTTVPGALYYSLFHDGSQEFTYELLASFASIDISEGEYLLNTNQEWLSVHSDLHGWIDIQCQTAGVFDPYEQAYNPPSGWNGIINGIGKRVVIGVY